MSIADTQVMFEEYRYVPTRSVPRAASSSSKQKPSVPRSFEAALAGDEASIVAFSISMTGTKSIEWAIAQPCGSLLATASENCADTVRLMMSVARLTDVDIVVPSARAKDELHERLGEIPERLLVLGDMIRGRVGIGSVKRETTMVEVLQGLFPDRRSETAELDATIRLLVDGRIRGWW